MSFYESSESIGTKSGHDNMKRKTQGVYIVKPSTLSCTVGAPLITASGDANEEDSDLRTVATNGSGPETT